MNSWTTKILVFLIAITWSRTVGVKVMVEGWERWVWVDGMAEGQSPSWPCWWKMRLCSIRNILLLTFCGDNIEASPIVKM